MAPACLSDRYPYLILDGVSVRLRLVGPVQRRVALCAYGITKAGKGELIDFLLLKSESQESWKRLLRSYGSAVCAAQLSSSSSPMATSRWSKHRAKSGRALFINAAGYTSCATSKPAQSFAVSLLATSQTHLSSAHSTGSARPLSQMEKPLAGALLAPCIA